MKPIHLVLIVAGEIVLALLAYGAGAGTGYFVGLSQAASGADAGSFDVAPDATVQLRVQDYRFSPDPLVVEAGKLTQIAIVNDDDAFHTFTYTRGGETFDHRLPGGETTRVLVKFDDAQTIAFHCKPHDGMRGEIIVEA